MTRNSGSSAWIISEEMSISRETKPSAQIPGGMARSVAESSLGVGVGLDFFVL